MPVLFSRFVWVLMLGMLAACAGKAPAPPPPPVVSPPPQVEEAVPPVQENPEPSGGPALPPPPVKKKPVVKPQPAVPEKPQALTNSLGMTFVWIPEGKYHMGSPASDPDRYDDEIRREVTLSRGYYLMSTEVTQGQWKAVMGQNPSGFQRCGDTCPVERVSWEEVQAFIKKLRAMDTQLRYRLPTEAEWEYAARAGSVSGFCSGRCLGADAANYNAETPLPGCPAGRYRATPLPVGSFPANAFGLHDMHGNVWEWCQDVYAAYGNRAKVRDPLYQGPGSERVIRGGSWYGSARSCRSASRGRYDPAKGFNSIGFRLAGDK